jgi:hypothetical protein
VPEEDLMSKHTYGTAECLSCDDKLKQAHPTIAEWFVKCVKASFPEAHISWSYRDKDNQNECFLAGKSKLQYPNSQHNKTDDKSNPCAKALDLFRLDIANVGCWEYRFFKQIADKSKTDNSPIEWGGDWHTTHGFVDQDHFQLK